MEHLGAPQFESTNSFPDLLVEIRIITGNGQTIGLIRHRIDKNL